MLTASVALLLVRRAGDELITVDRDCGVGRGSAVSGRSQEPETNTKLAAIMVSPNSVRPSIKSIPK